MTVEERLTDIEGRLGKLEGNSGMFSSLLGTKTDANKPGLLSSFLPESKTDESKPGLISSLLGSKTDANNTENNSLSFLPGSNTAENKTVGGRSKRKRSKRSRSRSRRR